MATGLLLLVGKLCGLRRLYRACSLRKIRLGGESGERSGNFNRSKGMDGWNVVIDPKKERQLIHIGCKKFAENKELAKLLTDEERAIMATIFVKVEQRYQDMTEQTT